MTGVVACVIHTMVGTLAGTDATFQNPQSQVSAHFGVGLNGEAHQYVNLADPAWANGTPNDGMRWTQTSDNANLHTVSIETEDLGQPDTQVVTPEQYATVLSLCRQAIFAYPTIRYLAAHEYLNPSHSCPGKRWLGSGKFDALADTLGLVALK